MKKLEEYSDQELQKALLGSKSIKDFMINIGMKVNSGNYPRAKFLLESRGLTTPIYDPSEHMRILKGINKMPDDEFFSEGVLRNSASIKKRLIQDHQVDNVCSICTIPPFWNGYSLVLQVDHIDGNRFNNKIDNLRLLCPNCHSQTETYGNGLKKKKYNYCRCGVRIYKTSTNCADCTNKVRNTTIDYPEVKIIVDTIIDCGGWSAAERVLGIGQNSLRKHLKRNGIEPSSIKYKRRLKGDITI